MTNMLSIGGSRAAAGNASQRFRRLFAVNLGLQSLIAVAAILFPLWLAGWVGMRPSPDAVGWIRVWGGMVIMASLFQIPGLLDPIAGRIVVITGIAGRFGMALIFLTLGGGFLWLAAFDGLFGLAILVALQSLIKAEIMTRS